MVCFRCLIVNILHKCEKYNNNNNNNNILLKVDLKPINQTEEELQKTDRNRTFNDDIPLALGLNKGAEVVLKEGKLFHSQI
jgi:hypothetical protein